MREYHLCRWQVNCVIPCWRVLNLGLKDGFIINPYTNVLVTYLLTYFTITSTLMPNSLGIIGVLLQ